MNVVAVCLALWLLVLTVGFAALARHVSTLALNVSTGAGQHGSVDLDADGPPVPSALPPFSTALLQSAGITMPSMVITFFSATCGPSIERASAIAAAGVPSSAVFPIGGADSAVTEVVNILRPSGAPLIIGDDATAFIRDLGVSSTPFGLRVEQETITGKGYIRGLADFQALVPQPLTSAVGGKASD